MTAPAGPAPREAARAAAGRRVMISCGEASGDLYAGALVAELKTLDPDVHVFGFGGGALARAGARLVGDYRRFAVTGLSEALAVLPRSYRLLRELRARAEADRPDVFVAIDFPDFNFRLLPVMRRLGVPVVYYVSPQLWAWRPGRLATLARYVTKMLVIFPFERDIYERAGVPVEFIGHPLVDLARATTERKAFLDRIGLEGARPVVALLPGSRPNEVSRILPDLIVAAGDVQRQVPGVQFAVARAPALDDELFAPADAARRAGLTLSVVAGEADNVLAAADVVVTASGTATVQAALHERPMVIVYRVSPLTYTLGRRLVRVSTYGMVNLVAGRRVVPELIQGDFTAERVREEVVSLLSDASRVETMRGDLRRVKDQLGEPGASRRAAEAVLAAARPLPLD